MKNILCYGDSNTYGFNPQNGSRYPKDKRWTGILSNILSDQYNVIEEGCNARTAYFESIDGLEQSGCKYFPICLNKYKNIDWIIIALGINDTQFLYNATEETIKKGLNNLIETAKKYTEAKILILCPSMIRKNILKSFFSIMFNETSIEKSKLYPQIYERIAKEKNCVFLDLNKIVETSDIDGLHYNEDTHKEIARHLSQKILMAIK